MRLTLVDLRGLLFLSGLVDPSLFCWFDETLNLATLTVLAKTVVVDRFNFFFFKLVMKE